MRVPFFLALLVGVSGGAEASLLFTLDSLIFSGAPGDSVPITGTLSNPDLDPVYINNFSGILTSPDLSFDLTDLFTVVPSVLNDGDSYSGPIVAVIIDPLGQAGDFFASITLQGGVDTNAFDDLATENFQFTISASAPEQTSFCQFSLGIIAFIAIYLSRGRRAPRDSPNSLNDPRRV